MWENRTPPITAYCSVSPEVETAQLFSFRMRSKESTLARNESMPTVQPSLPGGA